MLKTYPHPILITPLLVLLLACGDDHDSGGRACTAIGCTSGFTITLEDGIRISGNSRLIIDLDLDGEPRRCELSAGDKPTINENCGAITFDWEGDTLKRFIVHDDDPDTLGLIIQLDEQELHKLETQPDYQHVQPNGPGCPPECRQALITL